MPGFEDDAPEVEARLDESALGLDAGVSRQQERGPGPRHPQDQGALVCRRDRRAGLLRPGRVQDLDRDVPDLEAVAAAAPAPHGPGRQGLEEVRVGTLRRGGCPFPKLADTKVPGHGHEAVDMIGVGMGQDQDVDPREALPPEDRGHDALPDVERTAGEAAAVDDHGLAVREFDQDRFALADVDHRDPEAGRGRPERTHDQQDREGEAGREEGRPLRAGARPDEDQAERRVIARDSPGWRGRHADRQERQGVQGVRHGREQRDQRPEQRRRQAG
jgi:hypothetical protein